MKKVGIIGGTFNPIHLAHLMIAETAYEKAGLDEILFIPSGISYMKSQDTIVSNKHRLTMTGLAIEDNPHFALSTIDMDRDGNSYTYDTLCELHEKYPDNEFYFIMGADNLFTMETWKNPEGIFQMCTILAAVRGAKKSDDMIKQAEMLTQKYGARINLLPMKHIDISSTEIRDKIASGQSVRYILPEKVRLYIERNKLYLSKEE